MTEEKSESEKFKRWGISEIIGSIVFFIWAIYDYSISRENQCNVEYTDAGNCSFLLQESLILGLIGIILLILGFLHYNKGQKNRDSLN